MERTCVLIKPDGIARGLVGEIVSRFERRGCRIVMATTVNMTEELLAEHYAHLIGKPFFADLKDYMMSGPVIALVLEAPNAVEAVRQIIGATDPIKAGTGTVRGDFATSLHRNLVHASDSLDAAAAEIARFFPRVALQNTK
ncbi:MAG: nucleoside-diphosphate kinase [Bacillota bacterium]|nr:nucleoside-diphosphate kinase [Bacillota bacterium]HOB42959.1 nucleoside-diphosphate kinase [Bacillota bacterium]HPZ14068.1 nucleoside-diphosphate kinase [Bacillota bacterium]HQD80744.1 nucleoside-diphosphate kinase [Bacillota bacterium]